MNYKEMLEIVSKVWINSNDIMKLCNCGKNTANKIIALASSSKTKNKYLLKTMNIINRRINGTKKYHNPAFMYNLIE